MHEANTSSVLPAALKWAAALFVLYGVGIALNVVAIQGPAGWAGVGDRPGAILNLLTTGLIGWGLLRRARWARWLGLLLGALWLAAGGMALLVYERGDIYWPSPSGFQLLLVGSLACLGAALALLLTPSARGAFRRQ